MRELFLFTYMLWTPFIAIVAAWEKNWIFLLPLAWGILASLGEYLDWQRGYAWEVMERHEGWDWWDDRGKTEVTWRWPERLEPLSKGYYWVAKDGSVCPRT